MCSQFVMWNVTSPYTNLSMRSRGDVRNLQSSGIEGVLSVSIEDDSPEPHNYLHVNEMLREDPKFISTFVMY